MLDAAVGAERYLLPPARAGETLRGLGITEIVVHRKLLSARALALLDPVFFKLYGAPQRDHAGGVDLYRLSATGPARVPVAETLHDSASPAPEGWLSLADFLAGLTPSGVPAGGAPKAGGPSGGPPTGPPNGAAGGPAGASAAGAPAEDGARRERPPTPVHKGKGPRNGITPGPPTPP
jgi:hypothetical protein